MFCTDIYVFLKIRSFQYLTTCTNPCNPVQFTLQLFCLYCVCSRLFRYFFLSRPFNATIVSIPSKILFSHKYRFLYLSQNEDERNRCQHSICTIPVAVLLLICFPIEARILSKIAYFLFALYLSEVCAFQYLALVNFFLA